LLAPRRRLGAGWHDIRHASGRACFTPLDQNQNGDGWLFDLLPLLQVFANQSAAACRKRCDHDQDVIEAEFLPSAQIDRATVPVDAGAHQNQQRKHCVEIGLRLLGAEWHPRPGCDPVQAFLRGLGADTGTLGCRESCRGQV